MIRRWNGPDVGPPVGRYSHLALAPADHDLLFISGQVGALPDGTLAGAGAGEQTRQIYRNIAALLTAAGAGPEHLVKVFTMVAGSEHLAASRAARAEIFELWFPAGDWPAQSMVVVSALAAPGIVVEVEGFAAVPGR